MLIVVLKLSNRMVLLFRAKKYCPILSEVQKRHIFCFCYAIKIDDPHL